jgi:hypothetical protein
VVPVLHEEILVSIELEENVRMEIPNCHNCGQPLDAIIVYECVDSHLYVYSPETGRFTDELGNLTRSRLFGCDHCGEPLNDEEIAWFESHES